MAAPYTINFGYGHLDAPGDVLLKEIPLDDTYVLRDVIVRNSLSGPVSVDVYFQAGPQAISLIRDGAIPALSSRHDEMRQVLPPGSQLRMFCDSSGVTVTTTGYWLRD
jgi:hypothetical protein